MNEWGLGRSVIHSCIALILWEEERMSFGAFDVVVVVDWYIHEVTAVESEGCALFGFCEDIGPHYFCWAVHDFEVVDGYLITNEVISAFDVFCLFGTGE
jgi:gentisate 1,2-dioxygenase